MSGNKDADDEQIFADNPAIELHISRDIRAADDSGKSVKQL